MSVRPRPRDKPGAPDIGLDSQEAARRLAEFGPNEMPEFHESPVRRVLRQLWAPVPWMLEATIVLQLVTGERMEAILVAALLVINALVGLIQEGRANATLALLRQRLAPRARVFRDGVWSDAPAAVLVPGDIVELALGGVVPADVRLISGGVSLDQSTLTGESAAVERGPGDVAYAGALVSHGEAVAEVSATGAGTFFGRTAELVATADVVSSEQQAVLGVVKALTAVNAAIVTAMVAYALTIHLNLAQIIPLVLAALLAAVPVAMPAVFTLTAALGARRLADNGVLLARLSALQEAAMIDVLCVDKTGTLTTNVLSVAEVVPVQAEVRADDVLVAAAAASASGGKDPVDAAVRRAAAEAGAVVPEVLEFTPFDPTTKMSEALIATPGRALQRVAKGSPLAIGAIATLGPAASAALDQLTAQGCRVLVVAAGPPETPVVTGLIGLADPPREDSPPLLNDLRELGVGTVMVTGDTASTAGTVAHAIGLQGAVCPAGRIPEEVGPEDYAIYAGVFPEDKFRLVQAFQRRGHAVGMCGDGANDAPALRQAQMGIAVANATDVAKSAAGLVLTQPGLRGIVACVDEGRAAFQRVLTFTLGMLVNKSVTLLVMGGGLVMTGSAVLTPLLQVIWMLTSDIPMMARAGDRATPTAYPNEWRIRDLVLVALPLGSIKLVYVMGVLAAGWFWLRLPSESMRTLTFLTLVLAGQTTGLILRTRLHFWRSRPAAVLLIAMATAMAVTVTLAWAGWFMTPLPGWLVVTIVGTTVGYGLVVDTVKVAMFRRRPIDRRQIRTEELPRAAAR